LNDLGTDPRKRLALRAPRGAALPVAIVGSRDDTIRAEISLLRSARATARLMLGSVYAGPHARKAT
jgi:hypothetical protein